MNPSEYVVYVSWDPETDSAATHAERVRESLTEFGILSPALRSWSILDRDTASPVPVDKADTQFDEIVLRGLVAVVNPEQANASISFSVIGAGRRSFRGACAAVLEVKFGGNPDPSIVGYPVLKSIAAALAPIWNATYANVYTNTIRQFWDEPSRFFDLSWMTYLSESFAEQISIPQGVSAEETPGGGVMLSSVNGDFDVSNPQHMAAARSLRNALGPLNKLYRPPWST